MTFPPGVTRRRTCERDGTKGELHRIGGNGGVGSPMTLALSANSGVLAGIRRCRMCLMCPMSHVTPHPHTCHLVGVITLLSHQQPLAWRGVACVWLSWAVVAVVAVVAALLTDVLLYDVEG